MSTEIVSVRALSTSERDELAQLDADHLAARRVFNRAYARRRNFFLRLAGREGNIPEDSDSEYIVDGAMAIAGGWFPPGAEVKDGFVVVTRKRS